MNINKHLQYQRKTSEILSTRCVQPCGFSAMFHQLQVNTQVSISENEKCGDEKNVLEMKEKPAVRRG